MTTTATALESHIVGTRLLVVFYDTGYFQLQTYHEVTGESIVICKWTIRDLLDFKPGVTVIGPAQSNQTFFLTTALNALFWIWIERHGPPPEGKNNLTPEAVRMYRPHF